MSRLCEDNEINKSSKLAEEKRLKSIMKMKNSYRKRKDTIKAALMNVDISPRNKIVFNDNAEDQVTENNIPDYVKEEYNLNFEKRTLFTEGEDEIEYNFEIKEQFQGKKGRKLMELQSKFKSDKRFAMDERFIENDEESFEDELQEEISETTFKAEHPHLKVEEAIEDTVITTEEKEKELSILENVLGKELMKTDQYSQPKKIIKSVSMTRYDPSRPDHSKFLLKEKEVTQGKKQKKKDSHQENVNIEIEKPLVSKDVFYEVKDNLRETLQESKSFSLLNMFGSHQDADNKIAHNNISNDNQTKEKGDLFKIEDKNPFRYDSSDDESNSRDQDTIVKDGKDEVQDKAIQQNVSLGPARLWTEPFFFKDDDYRLQEGIDFVRKFELDDKLEFKQVRRNIKEIVRAKVRHNQRKNKQFKRKIGGRKLVKLKKAMKNR